MSLCEPGAWPRYKGARGRQVPEVVYAGSSQDNLLGPCAWRVPCDAAWQQMVGTGCSLAPYSCGLTILGNIDAFQ